MANIRMVMTFEYPVDMSNYPECETLEEVIELDKQNLEYEGALDFLLDEDVTPVTTEWTALPNG